MSETLWDAPNQQVVRADASPPWQEGTGGGGDVTPGDLSSMTKAQLLDVAAERGVEVDSTSTKADILAALGG